METWQEALSLIPDHMHDGVTRYLEHGVLGAGFMTCVFSNDLIGACTRADLANEHSLARWGRFLQYCPHGSYGSRSHVTAWEKSGGLMGRAAKQQKETENAQRV